MPQLNSAIEGGGGEGVAGVIHNHRVDPVLVCCVDSFGDGDTSCAVDEKPIDVACQ